jgi:hypothetical protein
MYKNLRPVWIPYTTLKYQVIGLKLVCLPPPAPPQQLFFLASSLFKGQRPLHGYTVKTVFRYVCPFKRVHFVQ